MKKIPVMALLWWLAAGWTPAQAQEAVDTSSASSTAEAAMTDPATSSNDMSAIENDGSGAERRRDPPWRRWGGAQSRSDNARVTIVGNVNLPAGEQADAVVAIMGNTEVAGTVNEAVVTIMGNSRVTGPVGEAVVTLMGNSYINSAIDGDVVTLLGNVELGPQAQIRGELVNVAGTVQRDPAAMVERMQTVGSAFAGVDFGWFSAWVKECVLYGRLLAFDAEVSWAWWVAGISLLLYVLTAAVMPLTVAHNVKTLESWPGRSLLAALVSIPLTPVLMLLLAITIVGLFAIPFVWLGLLLMTWFGKLVMLAWLGQRLLRAVRIQQPNWALAALLGGSIVMLLYAIPVVGMLVYHAFNFIGFGAVLYSMLMMFWPPAPARTASYATNQSATIQAQPLMGEVMGEATPVNAPAPAATDGNVYAGFWPRMGALAIDVVLMLILTRVLSFADVLEHSLLLMLALYGLLMWKFKGTTVGGIVFHLHVQREDGRELDWTTSIVRALSCFLSLFAVGLGFIWIALDAKRQAWHDKLAGTVVVRTEASQPLV